jgi:hypothetical protein
MKPLRKRWRTLAKKNKALRRKQRREYPPITAYWRYEDVERLAPLIGDAWVRECEELAANGNPEPTIRRFDSYGLVNDSDVY